ncbi:DUF3793 family protein [Lachnoclostridium phytofermentans]|uniref:DUF3793 domain-containing protein n=1 Tax=Lachnoclostridium phytofermentans (strain ATCC 700394 / DSM 18823 / ISDg) TaxID=357809 RepID=A9KKR7_LACP7|nr:DUF3793 family protein [Lachnoclostridium phytofermentans]ABX42649.1 hypothetical protein Cphy_2288 [Lachnoclostridium phytofermentans ISDg]
MKVLARYGSSKLKKLNQMFLGLLLPCAPVIMHCRAACSLSVMHKTQEQIEVFGCFLHLILCNQLLIQPVVLTEDFTVYLIYREDMLLEKVNDARARLLLDKFNYPHGSLSNIVSRLSIRLEEYFFEEEPFPHEIGVFLGYPIEDILEFIKEDGKNSLITGYWKVYYNAQNAIKIFSSFDLAKEEIYQWYLKNQRLRF